MYPPIQETLPEVFILESLSMKDEKAGNRYEGRVLYDVLKMCGKSPQYYYFRTEQELIELAKEFRKSGYRFLHLSCHGNGTTIFTTLGEISYYRFAEIFSGFLQNRRLFVSACEVGNELFKSIVSVKNKGMYSVACPTVKIRFDHAVALWSALYVHTFSKDENYVKVSDILFALESLYVLFEVPFYLAWYQPNIDRWKEETIDKKFSSKLKSGTCKEKFIEELVVDE
jgi:hypothetical protein